MHPTVDSILDANKYNLHNTEINTQANQDVIEIENFHDGDKHEIKNDDDARFPNANFKSRPSLSFDDYLLTNYGVDGEKNVVEKDDDNDSEFKPSKREPELVQLLSFDIPENWRNLSVFQRNNFLDNGPPIYSRGKNNKPFIAKSYHTGISPLPIRNTAKHPGISLGYQAAQMAEKYRKQRYSKKKRKVRRKVPKPQPGKHLHRKFRQPYHKTSFKSNYPSKSDIGVTMRTTSTNAKIAENTFPPNPYNPQDNALLLLAPSGPRVPILDRLTTDMSNMMSAHFDPTRESLTTKVGNSMYDQGRYIMEKITSGTLDGEMDIFDFLPVIGVIVAGALLVAGLFPTALTSFGYNNGAFVIGRKLDEKRGRYESMEKDLTSFGVALNHLEAGMMLMNAIRHEDTSCTEMLACRMAEKWKGYSDDPLDAQNNDWMLSIMEAMMPKSLSGSKFSRSFRMVLDGNDISSCSKECHRCVEL